MADKLHDIDVGKIVHMDKVSKAKPENWLQHRVMLLAASCNGLLSLCCCIQVLMVGSKVATLIGRPMVLGAEVFNETLARCAFLQCLL